MHIKKKLDEIRRYYIYNRQVGHTYTVLNGVINNDKPVILLTHTENMRRFFKPLLKKEDRIISLDHISGTGALMGYKYPMVIDNAAMIDLCCDALRYIDELETENDQLRNKINQITHICIS